MPSFHRHPCLALLLVLLLCLTGVGVHGATHASVDLNTCEYCSGQANPAHAIPVSAAPPALRAAALTAVAGQPFLPVSPAICHFQPRAPPGIARP